jgi:hypothetical protein
MWTTFHCDDPDFCVRSVRDGTQYHVQRSCLSSSEVFRTSSLTSVVYLRHVNLWTGDMFACCDMGYVTNLSNDSDPNQILDLDEPGDVLEILLQVLHFPPPLPIPHPHDTQEEKHQTEIRTRRHVPASIIPLPLLPQLFHLADKYILSETITQSLRTHLEAHSPTHPLQVYGFATTRAWDTIAAEASKFLLHPPLSAYTIQEVKVIPTVEAYQKLVLLHAFRVKRLREVLLAEEIFPHGYGACPTHRQQASELWERKRSSLAPLIEAGMQFSSM